MGKPIANPYGDKICPQCGKTFYVNWTDQWVYKRFVDKAERCFCSWKCVREFDKKGEEKQVNKKGKKRVISQELEAQAVDIAMDGCDPIQFLKDHGSTDPQHMWYRIRARLKTEDPESYEKLPRRMPRKKDVSAADAMKNMKDATDKFFGECEAIGLLNAETPESFVKGPVTADELYETFDKYQEIKNVEAPKIYEPVNYGGMTVREVEGSFARYRRSDVHGSIYIDVETIDGCDTLSYTVEQWRNFRKEQDRAAEILGVEL